MTGTKLYGRARRVAALGFSVLLLLLSDAGQAQDEEAAGVAVKGRILGGEKLLNPVWNEAKDPKNRRYSFRAPSATVGKKARVLTAYLPKELCIVALQDGTASAWGKPYQINVSGGRTTPVTLVIPEGQNVQFVNHDPFPHKLYDVKQVKGGMAPEKMDPTKQRSWKPPGPGMYEIRDKHFPSLRSWIVVEPSAAAVGYPTPKNEFVISDLKPGNYKLQAYFSGKPAGDPLPLLVRPGPPLQPIGPALKLEPPKKSKAEQGG